MIKTVKITTNNEISLVELPEWNIFTQGEQIGADCTEIVKTQRMYEMFKNALNEMIVMIVDESGQVNGKPDNAAASYLYGADMHNYTIAGDILFAVQDGPETLPPKNPVSLMCFLMMEFPWLREVKAGKKF